MKTIIKKWEQQYGYTPSFSELYSYYTQGHLILTDKEENEILKTYETIK